MSTSEVCSNSFQTQLSLPTIFDVLASDDLDGLLKPSFNYLIKMISQIRPGLEAVSNYKQQLYITLKTLADFYFLKTTNSSLSEMFYGIQRSPGVDNKLWRIKSILFLNYLPLLKEKLNTYYEEIKLQSSVNDGKSGTFASLCHQQFLAWYPVLLGIIRICNVLFVIGYVTSHTSYATFNLYLQKIKLIVSKSSQLSKQAYPIYSGLRQWIWRIVQIVVFVLQFQDWWQTNGENSSLSTNFLISGFRKVKPPKESSNDESQLSVISHGFCPVCENKRQVSAVNATTGILGCYECLRDYITENGCCPVTGCPTKEEDVMRLFLA